MKKTLVILAGGKSKRMGTNKALLKVGDKTLLEHMVNIFKDKFDEIYLSVNEKGNFKDLDINVIEIEDIHKGIGPMGGFHAVFTTTGVDKFFACAVDTPFVMPSAAVEMMEQSEDVDICALLKEDEKTEPLFAVYNRSCLPEIEKMIESKHYRLRELFEKTNVKYIKKYDLNKSFANLNTREEYEEALNLIKE